MILDHLRPGTTVVFAAFGPNRIMLVAIAPGCNVNGRGDEHAWSDWKQAVTRTLEEIGLTDDEKRKVWSGRRRLSGLMALIRRTK